VGAGRWVARCDMRSESKPPPHSIPFQVVCPPPPLLFSFFSALCMRNERTTHTTSLLLSYTHTHTCAEPNTPFSGSYFSHPNRNDNYARARPPALPPPDKRTGYAVLVLLRATADISPGGTEDIIFRSLVPPERVRISCWWTR
jgi:hypothetical protein